MSLDKVKVEPTQPELLRGSPAAEPHRAQGPSRPPVAIKREPSSSSSSSTAAPPRPGWADYALVSSKRNGWKHNIMKLHSHIPVDPAQFSTPVKLNRKEPPKPPPPPPKLGDTVLGPHGKPLLRPDGKPWLVGQPGAEDAKREAEQKAKEKEEGKINRMTIDPTKVAPQGDAVKNKANLFKKRTRQVFYAPEEERETRREEWHPWVLEDFDGREVWTGRLDGAHNDNLCYVLFISDDDEEHFKVVPVDKHYKFTPRPKFATLTTEEAEAEYARILNNRDPARWLMSERKKAVEAAAQAGGGSGETSQGRIKTEPRSDGLSRAKREPVVFDFGAPNPYENFTRRRGGPSAGERSSGGLFFPNRGRLRTVDRGPAQERDSDDDTAGRRRRQDGAEGDYDEVEYEEEFADDDERQELEAPKEDDEEKELEERIKADMRKAKVLADNEARDDDDEEEESETGKKLTSAGNKLRKLVKDLEKNDVYSSDEDKNPYASSEESSTEDLFGSDQEQTETKAEEASTVAAAAGGTSSSATTPHGGGTPSGSSQTNTGGGAALAMQNQNSKAAARVAHGGQQRPSHHHRPGSVGPGQPGQPRGSSPSGRGSSAGSGAAVVVRRATSPQRSGSRSASPAGQAAAAAGTGSSSSLKRKADGAPDRSTSPGQGQQGKRRKSSPSAAGSRAGSPGASASASAVGSRAASPASSSAAPPFKGAITEAEVVSLLKSKPIGTKEMLHHFAKQLKSDERNKERIRVVLKKVANLVDGVLKVKEGY